MKEELMRDSKRELQRQIHSTLNDWSLFLGSEDIINHLKPFNLKNRPKPLRQIPLPDHLQSLNLPYIELARAHIVNQLNFLLSIRTHINQGQLFAPEQIKLFGPKHQTKITEYKTKLKPKLEILDKDALEQHSLIQDTEILKRYIVQEKYSLEEIKHRLEQRKLNKLLQ